MNHRQNGPKTLIAAERRRKIHEWALRHGSVSVSWLAEALGVRPSTIRNDLDALHQEGKLIRSHGGAVIRNPADPRPPYSLTRSTNLQQKAWIGEAAVGFLPEAGSIFIGAGSTTHELAIRLPENRRFQIITNSAEIAICAALGDAAPVHLLGGKLRPESYATNCLADPAFEMLYWDVAFIGVPAVDVVRGITTVDQDAALTVRKIIEHSVKVVLLCDSSKFGRFSYARVGPVGLINVLVTDRDADRSVVEGLAAEGIEVVMAGPPGEPQEIVPAGNGRRSGSA